MAADPSQERERRGDYLGRTVQVVPHITDAIKDWITRVSQIPVDASGEKPDVCISMYSPWKMTFLLANPVYS